MTTDRPRVLVIDDEPDMLENCELMLVREGYEVFTLQDSRELDKAAETSDPDIVLTDLMMGAVNGTDVLRQIKSTRPDVPVIMMTAYATVETAVEAMKSGAADYVVKPFSREQLLLTLKRVLSGRELLLENRRLRQELGQHRIYGALVAISPAMQKVADLVSRVADTEATVMIQGESGTGKEVLARAIHSASRRAGGPFVAINCSALPANLMESELFGHEKGAFTGAVAARKGLLEEAAGGTFFFDEITEMDFSVQAKLLRALQERRIRRVGGNREVDLDIRIISATNRDPQVAVKERQLREDIYFRLSVVAVAVPPLRERQEDLPVLAALFLKEVAQSYGRSVEGFAPVVIKRFAKYGWPGNVRELRNVIERAVSLATHTVVREEDLPETVLSAPDHRLKVNVTVPYDQAKGELLEQFQKEYFEALIGEEKGNISRVAARAAVDRKTVYRIMKDRGAAPPDS